MNTKKFQSQFVAQLANPLALAEIFEHLPEIAFFVKDTRGRLVTASSAVLIRLGLKSESELVGRTDSEFYPAQMLDTFLADDAWVFRTGKVLANRLEVWLDERGQPDWSITTKVPLIAKDGRVAGLMGFSRRDWQRSAINHASDATRALDYLRNNLQSIATIDDWAKAMSLSARTLNRKLNAELGTPPYELILRVRVQAAAEALLKTSDSLSQIGLDCGFCDQSHFTQQFRKRIGMTPRKFRVWQNSMVKKNIT